jgi:hypothetical protein
MYVDSQNEFSDAQQVLNTAISANVFDLFSVFQGGAAAGAGIPSAVTQNTRIDIGQGEDVYLLVNTIVAGSGGTAPTLTITLESADDAALTVNPTVHFSSGALASAAFFPVGANLVAIKLPSALFRRFVGVRYTMTGGPLTTFTVDAFIAKDLQQNRIYRSLYSVV